MIVATPNPDPLALATRLDRYASLNDDRQMYNTVIDHMYESSSYCPVWSISLRHRW
jgi:hypothetical protein